MTYGHTAALLGTAPSSLDDARQQAFGQVIRAHRETRGWSAQRLGDELSWPAGKISSLEQGRSQLTLRSTYWLADALGVSLIMLLADVEVLLMDQEWAS